MIALLTLLACGGVCGDTTACKVNDGAYLAVLPEEGDRTPVDVFVYFHGYNTDAEAQVDKAGPKSFREAGWLTVFPEGRNNSWSNVGAPSDERDELAFVEEVLADVAARWSVTGRVVVSGHSQGSSMAWDVACYRPTFVDALAGASGSFWVPEPVACSASVPVRHTHGLNDNVMPLEGRSIGAHSQGSVDEGIEAWLATNGCDPDGMKVVEKGAETCQVWSSCASGDPVELCLYEGGHGMPGGWGGRMLDWLDTL